MRADGGLALTGGSGEKGSEFEHILKEPLTGFPDGLGCGAREQETVNLAFELLSPSDWNHGGGAV